MPPAGPARYAVRRAVAAVLALLVVVLVVTGGTALARRLAAPDPAPEPAPGAAPAEGDPGEAGRPAAGGSRTPDPRPTPTATPAAPARFTVVAGGDVLPHTAVIESAATATGYDFRPLLDPLAPWVAGADLALCHLEVPIAPAGTAPTGYPSFGAPRELADALAATGWDGCSTASNHALDRGLPGLVTTLDVLDDVGLGHVGTARTATEASAPQLYRLERAGRTLTVAHLAGTYALNGNVTPPDAPWAVTALDTAALVTAATAARAAGADLVLVSVHCCVEYVTAPSERQVAVAQALAASGVVDLLIGHHAHVPQPVERVAGGPGGAGMWVLHGLGNLLSNQDAACCVPDTASGLLATVDVVAPPDEPPRVTGVGWTGTTVDRAGGHRVHAVRDVAEGTATLPAAEVAARAARVAAAAGPAAPERTEPPVPTGPPPTVVPRPR